MSEPYLVRNGFTGLSQLFNASELSSVDILEQLADVQANRHRDSEESLDALLASCRGSLYVPERRDALGTPNFPPITPSGHTPSKLGLGTVPALATFLANTDIKAPVASRAIQATLECLRNWRVQQPSYAIYSSRQWQGLMQSVINHLLRLVNREGLAAADRSGISAAVKSMLAGVFEAAVEGDNEEGVDNIAAMKAALVDRAADLPGLLMPTDSAELLQVAHGCMSSAFGDDTLDGLLPVLLSQHLLSAAARGGKLSLKQAADLEQAATRKLQQVTQPILASVEDRVLDTCALEEALDNLAIPWYPYTRALAGLAGNAAVFTQAAGGDESSLGNPRSLPVSAGKPAVPSSRSAAMTRLEKSEKKSDKAEVAARDRMHAASRAALQQASKRKLEVNGGIAEAPRGVIGLLGSLLDIVEGFLAFCWEVGVDEEMSQQVLHLAAGIVAEMTHLLRVPALAGTPAALEVSARLGAVKLSAALMAKMEEEEPPVSDGTHPRLAAKRQPWQWDLHASLASGNAGTSPGAESLWRHSTEASCQAAAAAWANSSRLEVEALLVLLEAGESVSATEYQTAILTLGRLVAVLNADEGLLRVASPLISGGAIPPTEPSALACLSQVLACIAVEAATANVRWAYDQLLDVLIKSYRPGGAHALGILLYDNHHPNPCTGVLASALQHVAERSGPAPETIRADLELRLLSLFSEVGFEAKSEGQLRDLGALLPAIASSWHEQVPPPARQLMSSSAIDFQALQAHQRTEAKLVQLYRVLWMYVAVHGLWKPTSSNKSRPRWPVEWQQAASLIAKGPTPLLVAGGEIDTARVEAEFGDRIRRLCKIVSPLKLAGRVLEAVAAGELPPAGLVATSGHPTRNVHLLSTLVLSTLRVGIGAEAEAPAACPMAPLFATLQVAPPKSWELPWLAAITERVAHLCIENLAAPSLSQEQESGVGRRQLLFAQTLIQNLREARSSSRVRDLADRLLGRLLERCRGLLWDKGLLASLLAAQQETDAAGYSVGIDPRISTWITWVVEKRSMTAPGLSEAMLHEHISNQPDSGPAQEAQNMLPVSRAVRRKSPLGILEGSLAGVAAVHMKAHYCGVLSGAAAGLSSQAVFSRLTGELLAALAPGTEHKVLHDKVLEAAAAVVTLQGTGQAALLRTLCWLPTSTLSPQAMRVIISAWQWVATAAPELQVQVQLLAEITAAWTKSLQQGRGLARGSKPSIAEPAAVEPLGGAEVLVDGISGHHLWIIFLLEAWQAFGTAASPGCRVLESLMWRWLTHTLTATQRMTHHPAAAGAFFRTLLLALRLAVHFEAREPGAAANAIVFARVINAAVSWFDAELGYYGGWSATERQEELAAVKDFSVELEAVRSLPRLDRSKFNRASLSFLPDVPPAELLSLLKMLLKTEIERLEVWADPLASQPKHVKGPSAAIWEGFAATAWSWSPRLAVNLISRFPGAAALKAAVAGRVVANAASDNLRSVPAASELVVQGGVGGVLTQLESWQPASILQAMHMLSGHEGQLPEVRAYALRSLHACDPQQVAFFLPQLVQLLRSDGNGMIQAFLIDEAAHSTFFAHHLVCTLRSEGTPPEEAFNPTVKRSGWKPPQDSGLWKVADSVEQKVWESLSPEVLAHLKAELAFFDDLTNVSGRLYPVPKDERKAAAVNLVRQIEMPRDDLYMPTNPASRVLEALPESATPMQSAAKVPILVAFKVDVAEAPQEEAQNPRHQERVQACIFKVGDDCRQDVLALQVIALLGDAFKKADLGLFVAPYGVLPTAYECGIIEVVPDSKSRSALGETCDGGLLEIWCREFGAPGTATFEKARRNFIISAAGYAVACFLLQAKDRHNGNILVSSRGHLVHIDFGFILEISPGGNLGFESAAFKLSHEMTQLLDPGGTRASPQFKLFQELCIRGYLAARTVAEGVITSVALMSASGLPCFGRGAPVEHLRQRFRLELADAQAAAFMQHTIADAYDKWTTGFYDFVQYLQNAIPK